MKPARTKENEMKKAHHEQPVSGVDGLGMAMVLAGSGVGAAVSAIVVFLIMPLSLGVPLLEAYQDMQPGSHVGNAIFTTSFLVLSAGSTMYLARQISRSPAREAGGRHRIISLIGCSLVALGAPLIAGYLPAITMSLALEHITPWQARALVYETLALHTAQTGAFLVLAALLLGAGGMIANKLMTRSQPTIA